MSTAGPGQKQPQQQNRSGSPELPQGAAVRLGGLQGAAHLNGEVALVLRFVPEKGRYEVALHKDGSAKALQPSNISLLPLLEEVQLWRDELQNPGVSGDEALAALRRLSALEITVDVLMATRVGKAVNEVAKRFSGLELVTALGKKLVKAWREMFQREQAIERLRELRATGGEQGGTSQTTAAGDATGVQAAPLESVETAPDRPQAADAATAAAAASTAPATVAVPMQKVDSVTASNPANAAGATPAAKRPRLSGVEPPEAARIEKPPAVTPAEGAALPVGAAAVAATFAATAVGPPSAATVARTTAATPAAAPEAPAAPRVPAPHAAAVAAPAAEAAAVGAAVAPAAAPPPAATNGTVATTADSVDDPTLTSQTATPARATQASLVSEATATPAPEAAGILPELAQLDPRIAKVLMERPAILEFLSKHRSVMQNMNAESIAFLTRNLRNSKDTLEEEDEEDGCQTCTVTVSNLHPEVREIDVSQIFTASGLYPVEVRLPRESRRQRSCGVAMVALPSREDARGAVRDLQGAVIRGRPVRIEAADGDTTEGRGANNGKRRGIQWRQDDELWDVALFERTESILEFRDRIESSAAPEAALQPTAEASQRFQAAAKSERAEERKLVREALVANDE